VFNLERLRQIETKDPIARGYLDPSLKFVEDGGALRIWEWPNIDGVYVIGADPSQGMEHGDYASVHVINARDHSVVAAWHGHIDPDLLGTDVLARLGKFYNKALIGVESNNHGLTTLKFLQRARYFPIYYQRSPQYKRSIPTDVLGYRTTQVTKPLMIDELGESLRSNMQLWCSETVAELRTFVRDDKGKMKGSPFDDRTISLAIANQMLKFVWMSEFQPEKEPPPGSFGDWERRLYGETFTDLIGGSGTQTKPRPAIGGFSIRTK
jgi:hypothetical protein